MCWKKFRKFKSYFNNFYIVLVRNGHGLGTLKFAVSQEWIDKMSWFFSCWYKFRKAKRYFNNYWVGMVKNEWGFIDHGTLKSGVSHKWFDEFSIFIEWFLHANTDRIIFVLMISPIYFASLTSKWWGPLQLYLKRVFRKNFRRAKMTPK